MIETKRSRITYKGKLLEIEYFLRHGQKETVLYLHGLGCSKVDFINATEVKSLRAHTIIGFDFPGYAGSSYSENLGMDDLVEITNLFIEQLGLKNIILIGHSMGGLVALLLVQKYVGKIKSFVNIEGNLNADDCFFSREVIKYSFNDFLNHGFDQIKQAVAAKKNKGFQIYSKHLQKVVPRAYYSYSSSMTEYSTRGNLLKIFIAQKIPKLFIYGSENKNLAYLKRLGAGGIELAEISNSNHWPQYDNPHEFYNVISNFIEPN